MTLFEIDEGIRNAVLIDSETGEVVGIDFDAIEALQLAREKKIDGVIRLSKEHDAMASALDEEIKKLTARKKAHINAALGAKNWLRIALNGERYESAAGKVSYRNTRDQVVIVDKDSVPLTYWHQRYTDINKTAIKEALLAGGTVPGADLEDRVSTIIK